MILYSIWFFPLFCVLSFIHSLLLCCWIEIRRITDTLTRTHRHMMIETDNESVNRSNESKCICETKRALIYKRFGIITVPLANGVYTYIQECWLIFVWTQRKWSIFNIFEPCISIVDKPHNECTMPGNNNKWWIIIVHCVAIKWTIGV